MKKSLFITLIILGSLLHAQKMLRGTVIDESTNLPLTGVNVSFEDSDKLALTDQYGKFELPITQEGKKVKFRFNGYETVEFSVDQLNKSNFIIRLKYKIKEIEGVNLLSTGYQKIPKERATGSFTEVDNRLFKNQVSTNVLDRLPGIAVGIIVDKGTSLTKPQFMIRGLSTIRGPKSPLIVIDNFPYDGDLGNINPNIVENITILKDASAASIWGARAANGVIVITTKTGKFNQPTSFNFTMNTIVTGKPDLSYIKQISSADFIELEQELFSRGFYNTDINSSSHPVISPVVALLDKEKKGLVDHSAVIEQLNKWKQIDMREEFKRYMYKASINKQYAFDVSGGSNRFSWSYNLGYDDNEGNLDERYKRINSRIQNTWQPNDAIKFNYSIQYNATETKSGRTPYGTVSMKNNNAVPYMQLADEFGNGLPVFAGYNQDYKIALGNGKLLDWNYYPLTDWQHNISSSKNNEIIIAAGLNYKIMKGLDMDLKYQFQNNIGVAENLQDEKSYYTINYINRFTQLNSNGSLTYAVPRGSIYGRSDSHLKVNNLRTQLNYGTNWNKSQINGLGGIEIRDINNEYMNNRFYGYNTNNHTAGVVDFTKPYPVITGGNSFIDNLNAMGETTNRFVSVFANAAYIYDKRLIFSASARRDASNLFGLKTNNQWNPFWSGGLAWIISNEGFYKWDTLPKLKIRSSYGYNGNVDPAMVAVSTVSYSANNSIYTGTKMAQFSNYFNPNLKWETIKTFNLGLEFSSKNSRVSGSIDYFNKKGSNLFGQTPMDYTTGITSMLWNVAGMKSNGADIELRTLNINSKIQWSSLINFSVAKEKVTKYFLSNTVGRQFVVSPVPISGVEGLPVYSIFAYKWAGLDPATGDPQGYLNGEISKDYAKITGVGTDLKDLQYFGSAVPTLYGSFINTISFKNFTLDLGVTYKLGYWFRRSSINYTNLYRDWAGHSDYALRWQKPGDELITNVPSNIYKTNTNRDAFYAGSSILVEKGDHVRLQFINFNYSLSQEMLNNLPLKSLDLYCNISNIGLLWKATKQDIDPDFSLGNNTLKAPLTIAFGLKTKF
ncbi:SusC/RagA family TonB-linked outer membrane protein [Epilithonimonas sp.]|nr:SusC/RagA family TonB-linked outer membrane protein [Epilithonimonas sp.]